MFSVIFDMDGTLLDTQSIYIPAWEYSGKKQKIFGMGEHIRYVCGMNEAGWLNYLKINFPSLDVEQFVKDVNEYITNNLDLSLKKGAEELLKYLKHRNIKMAVASGSPVDKVRKHLSRVGVIDYFEAFAGSRDVKNGKPAPDVFLLAAKRLGAKSEDCFVIEDSDNGIRAGYAAGMKCIGIPDVVEFSYEIKKLMSAEFKALDEVIDFFENKV